MTLLAAMDACVSLFRQMIALLRLGPGTRRSSVQRGVIALRIDAKTGAEKECVSDGRWYGVYVGVVGAAGEEKRQEQGILVA